MVKNHKASLIERFVAMAAQTKFLSEEAANKGLRFIQALPTLTLISKERAKMVFRNHFSLKIERAYKGITF